MTHYRMSYNLPSASILLRNQMSSSFDESRIYNENTVFMENKQEFSIKLFNPSRKKIGVQIGLNGELSKHLIVLKPGEDITIDRFIDNNSKMVFETYNYDDSNPLASNAVANNGIIDVKFFNEKETYNIFNTNTTSTNITNINTTTTNTTLNSNYGTFTGSFQTTNLTNNHNVLYSSDNKTKSSNKRSRVLPSETIKETGMVSKGDKSDQSFIGDNTNFEITSFHTYRFFIKPNSDKPYEEQEVREYCTQCSYRIRNKKWNYCPKCGNKA